ncbi:MAG: hypothetical protein JXA07_09520 [Spirochaetes bacterium]|nr:hypothetical protein [Spirochaetota bacterium]
MPVQLNLFERIALLRLGKGPGPMADLMGVLAFKAVMTALRLGLFDAIGRDAKTIDQITSATGTDRAGLGLLIGALESLGYVRIRRNKIRNTFMTQNWLLHDSPSNISAMFDQFNDISARWEYLDESMRHGRPPRLGYEWLDQDQKRWDAYHAGLKSAAMMLSPEILKRIRIPRTAEHLLDLGGSHGQYSIEFCKRYPRLTGVVYDWPSASRIAMENILSTGLSGRISFMAGDFLKDELPDGQDIILMFNTIRIFDPVILKTILVKICRSLNHGGLLVIMDHIGKASPSRFMKANAYFVLLELFNSTEGRIYTHAEIADFLDQSGFSRTRYHAINHSPGLGIITATKP